MKSLSYFFLVFYFILFSQPSIPDVWIKDVKTDFFKFTSHLASLDSTHLSYGEYLLKLKREETKTFQIKDLILKAQEFYLSGEVESALEIFKEITSLNHLADWNEEQRRVIFYSFLRRAQNEKNANKKQSLLLSAGQFMISKITTDYPDYHLFPPPLLKELEQIQNQLGFLSIPLKAIFPNHEIILINGKQISLKEKIFKITESSYRVTVLSSSHTPWTKVVSISYLMNQSVKTKPLTLGYCKTLKIKNQWMKKDTQIFYNKNCENDKYLEIKENQKYKKGFDNVSNNNKYEKFNFLKNNLPTWLVVGTAILTTGIVLSFVIDGKDDSDPTLHY